ncbi:unnamed protein product [Lymnaea stagnalis]|uniref:Uncharacterized protein n=1 Tax=Lymnaea stagnalis TaxID=6523 RepID=A0AAV2HFA4_LYMST
MSMSFTDKFSDTSTRQGSELATTYFSYSGPTALDTSIVSPVPGPGSHHGHNSRKASIRSFYSDRGGNDVAAIPVRKHSLSGSDGLVIVAPPFPGYGYPGFTQVTPQYIPYDPTLGLPSDKSLRRRHDSRNPYENLQHLRMRHFIIFTAILFLVALIVVIFIAVYFGHGFEPKSNT